MDFLAMVSLWVGVIHHCTLRAIDAGPRCRHCGHDLTGNVSGVCPECGVAVLDPAQIEAPSAAGD
jgi:ABC-type ATPase with predicted acetyltransferase domain